MKTGDTPICTKCYKSCIEEGVSVELYDGWTHYDGIWWSCPQCGVRFLTRVHGYELRSGKELVESDVKIDDATTIS